MLTPFLILGCQSQPTSALPAPVTTHAVPEPEKKNAPVTNNGSIGQATMKANGTLVLQLRAEAEDGTVGDAQFEYPKGHEQYDEVIKHVGGLEPGQTKPVPPWPE